MTKQITHLNIDIKKPVERCSKIVPKIFALILSLCKKLIDLNFCDLFFEQKEWNRRIALNQIRLSSSTLTKLKINLQTFDEGLSLLNEDFECLTTLILHVETIYYLTRH